MTKRSTNTKPAKRIHGVSDVTTYVGKRFEAARRPGSPLDLAFRPDLEIGQRLEGADGQQRVERARNRIERLMSETLRGLDAMTMLLAARSISPRVWALLDHHGDQVQPGVRHTLELAIRKHATWKPSARQMEVVPSFLPGHLTALAKVFIYAEAYAGLMATERRVCKGQAHTVSALAPLEFDAAAGAVHRLIEVLDSRAVSAEDPLASFGSVSSGRRPQGLPPYILGAELVLPSEVIDYTGVYFAQESTSNGRIVRTADRTTRWGFIEDVGAFQQAVAPYDKSLRTSAGYGLVDMHAVEHLASLAILEEYIGRDLPPVLELLGFAVVPPVFLRMMRDISETHPYDSMSSDLVPTLVSLSKAYDRLIVHTADIDLSNPTVVPPFIDIPGGAIVFDLAAASLFGPLYLQQTLDEADRQAFTKDFEVRTHAMLADLGDQPWAYGHPLRVDGRDFTDADASIQVGDLFVVVDCFSSPWNRHLDSGSHPKVRNRADNLVRKLEKWQRQWSEIASAHAGLLPPEVDRVLPVVVTAGPEWVPSEAPHLWLQPSLPAIVTAQELHELVARHVIPEAHLIDVKRI